MTSFYTIIFLIPLHNRKSPRASRHDYASPGGYFITICTKHRKHYFGEVENGKMRMNILGKYCNDKISQIEQYRKHVSIHTWIVMPNHIHMIIVLGTRNKNWNTGYQSSPKQMATKRRDDLVGHPDNNEIDTKKGCATSTSLHDKDIINHDHYDGPTLGSIINVFKGTITKYANQHNIPFQWQSRYHDHIIRNELEYDRIKGYIINNPTQWEEDTFYD